VAAALEITTIDWSEKSHNDSPWLQGESFDGSD
jgi:hypothetical protein